MELRKLDFIGSCDFKKNDIIFSFKIVKAPFLKKEQGEIIAIAINNTKMIILIDELGGDIKLGSAIKSLIKLYNNQEFIFQGKYSYYYASVENREIKPIEYNPEHVIALIQNELFKL